MENVHNFHPRASFECLYQSGMVCGGTSKLNRKGRSLFFFFFFSSSLFLEEKKEKEARKKAPSLPFTYISFQRALPVIILLVVPFLLDQFLFCLGLFVSPTFYIRFLFDDVHVNVFV